MPIQPVTLTGQRAKLVPLDPSQSDAFLAIVHDARIWSYMPNAIASRDEVNLFIHDALRARDAGTELPFAIVDLDTERIVGSTRYLDITPAHRNLEIGWTWLSPEVWRTRINTECKYLLLRYAFEELKMIRVQLKSDLRNERSQRAMERIGAVREGVLRRHRVLPNGYVRDSVYYSIVDSEWPAVKVRLEGMLARE